MSLTSLPANDSLLDVTTGSANVRAARQQPLRVAVIGARGVGATYGGIENVLGHILPGLAERGFEIDVFVEGIDGESAKRDGFRLRPTWGLKGKYTETLSRTALSTVMAIKENYDIIHYHAVGPGALAFLPKLFGRPVVTTLHGLDWRRDKWPRFAQWLLRIGAGVAIKSASELTVVSQQLERYVDDHFGRSAFFTPNGLTSRTAVVDRGHLEKFGLEPGRFFLFAARLVREKGAHDLIRAFEALETTDKLVIAGDARYDLAYQAELKDLSADPRIVFTGHVAGKQLESLFGGARAFILPSYLEGRSLSLLEAISYGKACVVTDIAENLEVVGDSAMTYSTGNVEELRALLKRLIRSPSVIKEYETRSRRLASSTLSWSDVAGVYASAYNTAASRRRKLWIA